MKPEQPWRWSAGLTEISENSSSDINVKSVVLFVSKAQLTREGSEKLN